MFRILRIKLCFFNDIHPHNLGAELGENFVWDFMQIPAYIFSLKPPSLEKLYQMFHRESLIIRFHEKNTLHPYILHVEKQPTLVNDSHLLPLDYETPKAIILRCENVIPPSQKN